METCLLCLELQNDDLECIDVDSILWRKLDVQNLIEKHLWTMKTIKLSSCLCIKCWEQLNEFHKFYLRIEDAHMHFDAIMKVEIIDESENVVPETANKTETITEEQKVVKPEDTNDVWDDDNTPLMQLSKHKRKKDMTTANGTLIKDPLKTTKKRLRANVISANKTIKKRVCHKNITASKTASFEKTKTEPILDLLQIKKSTNEDTNHSDNNADNKVENKATRFTGNDKFIASQFKLECILCQIPMETFRDLCYHFEREHQQSGYALCCNKKFFQRSILSDHIHHHLDPDYLKCKDCGKICSSSYTLKHHAKIHDINRERKFCCDICGNRFVDRLSLNNHITRHLPEEEKLFPCPKCNKRFGNKWKLYGHVRESHESATTCDICGLNVVNKSALNIHKRIKHPADDDKKEYKCSICLKTYPGEHNLKKHTKFVHQTGYIHKCTLCTKAFKKQRSLKGHMASHTNTPLYTCPWCPKTFNCTSNIRRHRQKWHPKEEENQQNISKNYIATNIQK